MREGTEPNNMLVPVSDCMVPPGVLPGALVQIWHVPEDNGVLLLLLQICKLTLKPFKLVSRVVEGRPREVIQVVACVGVQGEYPGGICQLLRKVSVK